MKRKVKTMRVWMWRDCGLMSLDFEQPEWDEDYEVFGGLESYDLCVGATKLMLFLLGIERLPPKGTAWLVEVTAPGKSRVVKRMKGEETNK